MIAQACQQVSVSDRSHRHQVKHPRVLLHFVLLKPLDSVLSLVHRDEVYQLAVVFDFDVGLLDHRLILHDIVLLRLL